MRAATEGNLPPVMPQGNLVGVLGREVRQGSPGELLVESSPSHQRRPPCKTNKGISDEAADAAALTYLLTYNFVLLDSCARSLWELLFVWYACGALTSRAPRPPPRGSYPLTPSGQVFTSGPCGWLCAHTCVSCLSRPLLYHAYTWYIYVI